MESCCEQNMQAGTLVERPEDQDPERRDITVRRCPDCERRHIEADVDPLDLNLTGGAL